MGIRRIRSAAALVTLAVALSLALSGCLGLGGEDYTLSAPPGPKAAEQLWVKKSQPFGQPVNIGGVAVLFVKKENRLRIVAIDPPTGKVLWTDTAGPGFAWDSSLVPADIGGKVGYFRMKDSTGTHAAPIVIADPRTGKELAVSRTALFRSPVRPCSAGSPEVCIRLGGDHGEPTKLYRFSVATPELVEVKGLPADSRPMSEGGLFHLDGDKLEEVGQLKEGKLAWRRALTELFGPGFTAGSFWSFEAYPEAGAYAATPWRRSTGDTVDLTTLLSAGFSMADGTPLWKEPATYTDCFGSAAIVPPGHYDSILPLRCRYTGSQTYSEGKGWTVTKGSTFRTRLERFDPRTGKSVWSTPIGTAPIMSLLAAGMPSLIDDRRMVIDTGKATVTVDLVTGKATKTPATALMWCRTGSSMDFHLPVYFADGSTDSSIHSDGLVYPCTSNGKQISKPTLIFVPKGISASFDGGISVYATPKGVFAYRTARPS